MCGWGAPGQACPGHLDRLAVEGDVWPGLLWEVRGRSESAQLRVEPTYVTRERERGVWGVE